VVGDPWGRPDLATALPAPWGALLAASSLHPVGRLDADTSGLLLFSSRGDLTQASARGTRSGASHRRQMCVE